MTERLIKVNGLKKHFPVNSGLVSRMLGNQKYVKAVDGVSMEIATGEVFGLAGESGCGKSTLAKTIIGLLEATEGEVIFNGEDITEMYDDMTKLRREIQIIQQNPYQSLNPQFTVRRLVKEPLDIHDIGHKDEKLNKVKKSIEEVGLTPSDAYLDKYPSQLSGGERQRVSIARALILNPSLLVLDEPVSMLDVSIRAELLHILQRLNDEKGMTSIYISHDISLLKHVCDRIGIMYLGKIVELGDSKNIVNNPKHPYTQALIAATPTIYGDRDDDLNKYPSGEIPDPIDIPTGCRYSGRCPEVMEACRAEEPSLYTMVDGTQVRCILYNENEKTIQ